MNATENLRLFYMVSPVERIAEHPGIKAGISLFIKRDDLLHPAIQGNKWRKLEPVVQAIQQGKHKGILSFGGPFSNHLHALAAAGKAFQFPTAAIVRGLSADITNPTLAFARSCNMTLIPVPKKEYDAGMDSAVIQELMAKYVDFCILPEGGATQEAVESCAAVAREILLQTPVVAPEKRFIAVPAGTGTTVAGVIAGLADHGTTVVFPAAPHGVDKNSIRSKVELVLDEACPHFQFEAGYIFGEFAAYHPELIDWVRTFQSRTGILLDPIYTSKMMWGVFDMLKRSCYPEGSIITAVHTGGLQGWDGFRQRFGIDIYQPAV